ncbi:MAG: PepSY domain-containing protein [Gammaproteobacteria bacterium]|nr:PepSY domain-containing protein [Gammaproteobacteria bacterium]
MNIILSMARIMLVAMLLLVTVHVAWADDHVEARRLLEAGEILPLESILKKVRERFPGKIIEIKLETEENEVAYEVELLGYDGVVLEVYINAKTGNIMSSKEDD